MPHATTLQNQEFNWADDDSFRTQFVAEARWIRPRGDNEQDGRSSAELVDHLDFTFSPSSTCRRLFKMTRRLRMAGTVRFSFRAIEAPSIFESSSARSYSSSARVHGWPAGRGPSFISLSSQPELDQAADAHLMSQGSKSPKSGRWSFGVKK
jgi:hypothetical protein